MKERAGSPERKFQSQLASMTDALRSLQTSLDEVPERELGASDSRRWKRSWGTVMLDKVRSGFCGKSKKPLPGAEGTDRPDLALYAAFQRKNGSSRSSASGNGTTGDRASYGMASRLRNFACRILSSRRHGLARAEESREGVREFHVQAPAHEHGDSSNFIRREISDETPMPDTAMLRVMDPRCTCLLSSVFISSSNTSFSSLGDSIYETSSATWDFWRGVSEVRAGLVGGQRYAVGDLLWNGAMSRVYRGFDRVRDRAVAVKVVPPPVSEILRDSLEAIHSLEHPNLLRLEDYGQIGGGGIYLISPLLRGTSLRELLFARNEAVEALLFAVRKACEGLAHAHALGVVHRDLKPGNIQIESDGRTVVIDWGLACHVEEKPSVQREVLGTPLYMAPEQIEGEPVTTQTDIYSLGTLLYEILTGRNPSGPPGDLTKILHRVRAQTPPPPSALRHEIPPQFDSIVMKCLDKEPRKRYQNAGELLEELEGAGGWR